MRTRATALLPLWLILAALAPASQLRAEEPLDAFPEGTLVVVRIASVERVLGNANDLIAALGPAAAAAAPFAEQAIGGLLNVGAGLGAVERAAPAYVAVLSLTEPPQPAFLVRSPDEVKLRRAVLVAGENDTLKTEKRNDGFERVAKDETSWFFGRCGEWVLYTPSEQVVKLLAFDREKEKTFGSVVERHCVELLDAGDLSAAVNVAKLTETFKNEIEQARQQVLQGIEQLPDEQLSTGGADPRAIKKLYSDLATLAFDTLRDTRWAAGRLNFDAEGVRAEGALSVAEGSGTDALLAANPPSTLEHLGLLPAGAPAYAGMNFNSEQVTTWLRDWLSAAFATDEKKKEAIQAALEGFAKAGLGQIAGSFSLPAGPNTGMLVTMLFEAQDPNALRTAFRDYSVQLGESKNPMFTQTVEYTAAAETYKDHPVDLMLQGLQFNAQDPQLAIVQGLLTRFFGGAKFQTRLTTLEGMLVEATGNDPKFLHQLVDSLESGEGVLGLDDAFPATRDKLGDECNLILLLNVPQLIVDGVRTVRDLPPFNMILGQLPFNFGAQPAASYGGLSVATESRGLRAHLFVPVGQPKGVMQIFVPGF